MARVIRPAEMERHNEAPETPMQPVFVEMGHTNLSRPVPSLVSLEQQGGTDLDERLELPTREVWSTRFSAQLFDD